MMSNFSHCRSGGRRYSGATAVGAGLLHAFSARRRLQDQRGRVQSVQERRAAGERGARRRQGVLLLNLAQLGLSPTRPTPSNPSVT
ncbi:unnamed protein product [Nippostrongylus brasiliensis]|uniref:Uncharacterized protein n=1 Tax=Nippostrongylus brasiliensis TaxID=27835 RepID=A0A0N4Y9E7_NIPBR|nr:unnamed protein product [Nippostrongylus brasiliensis]